MIGKILAYFRRLKTAAGLFDGTWRINHIEQA
jgi:hypothetical protein